MSMYWCERCENKNKEGYINTDCFKDNGNIKYETPEEHFGGLTELAGVEII